MQTGVKLETTTNEEGNLVVKGDKRAVMLHCVRTSLDGYLAIFEVKSKLYITA